MNANPRLAPSLKLIAALSLALCVAPAHAQRRAGAKSAQPKQTQTKPAPKTQAMSPVEPAQTLTGGKQVLIRWRGRPGVERYRLQVARDRAFGDIVFDRAVVGLQAQVELPTGDGFFWRVAPAAQETGEFSQPEPVGASEAGRPVSASAASVLRSPANVGWQAFTGEVLRPQPAVLRGPGTIDVVAVNADGTVFALDGMNGSAMWTARYRLNAQRGDAPMRPQALFTPVVVRPVAGDKAFVVVAFDGGVRALEGETGRELWRRALPGVATGGVVADLNKDDVAAELAVVTDVPALQLLDARTGQITATQKMDAAVIGVPVPYITATVRGIACTMAGGLMDVRQLDGTRFRAVKFDVGFTTPPLVFTGPNGVLVVVGTEHGLLFLDGDSMKPLGKITTPDDSPRGRLGAADVDNDKLLEIVAVMKSGKVVMVSAAGHITWAAQGGSDAYGPTFVDLNGDGTLDVLVASDTTFAMGLNGRDGSLLWQADEVKSGPGSGSGSTGALRSVTVIVSGANPSLVISGDAAHAGVRAVGLPGGQTKVAAQ